MYPYNQQFGQFPQYQPMPVFNQQPQAPVRNISGRVVSSPDEITVQEVPTDGSLGLFPSADGSCIYGKRWNSNGTIETITYVQQAQEPPAPDRIDVLSSKVDKILGIIGGENEHH